MSSSNEIASYLLLLNIHEIWSRDTWMNFESPGMRIFKIGAPQQKIRSTEVKVHQNDKNAKYRKNVWIMKIYRFQILIWCKKHCSQSRISWSHLSSKFRNFTTLHCDGIDLGQMIYTGKYLLVILNLCTFYLIILFCLQCLCWELLVFVCSFHQ